MSSRHSAYLKLLLVVAIWGSAPPIVKYTLNYFPTSIFLSYRFLISILVTAPILFIFEKHWWLKLSTLSVRTWLILIANSLIGSTIQIGFLFWGMEHTSAIEGSIVNATSPILVAIAGVIFLHEKITRHERLGLITAFIGTAIIIISPILSGQNHQITFSGLGNLLIFLGTLAWAVFTVISKKSLKLHLSPLFLTTSMFFFGFISMSIITLFLNSKFQIENYFLSAPPTAHLGVLYMALLSGSLAYFLYQSATKHIEISEANLFIYLTPLFTLPISLFVLKESVNPLFILGCFIIILGVYLAEIKTRQRR